MPLFQTNKRTRLAGGRIDIYALTKLFTWFEAEERIYLPTHFITRFRLASEAHDNEEKLPKPRISIRSPVL